jgi:hypothetical protein
MQIKTRWLMLYMENGAGWLRLFRCGFGWKDTTKHPLTFSERKGYRRHLMIGKWSLGWLVYV